MKKSALVLAASCMIWAQGCSPVAQMKPGTKDQVKKVVVEAGMTVAKMILLNGEPDSTKQVQLRAPASSSIRQHHYGGTVVYSRNGVVFRIERKGE